MRNKFILYFFFSLCLFANTTFGQTAEQIKNKYGQPIKAYSVSEHIWMTPKFTAGGQVCMMRLYPKSISETANYLSKQLDYQELKDVINQLAPLEMRGKITPFFGFTNLRIGTINTIYVYEKISFSFLQFIDPYFDPIDKDKLLINPINFNPEVFRKIKLKEEMVIPKEAELVKIVWNKRVCAKK